jgi:hypothetical protein
MGYTSATKGEGDRQLGTQEIREREPEGMKRK